MTTKRGVVYHYDDQFGNRSESVCECQCHEQPIMHFRPCCGEPKTDECKIALEEFNSKKDD